MIITRGDNKMLAMDAGLYLYAGVVGGLIGAFFVVFTLKKVHTDNMKLIESYWKNDIRILKMEIDSIKLSPNSGDNVVRNGKKSFYNKR